MRRTAMLRPGQSGTVADAASLRRIGLALSAVTVVVALLAAISMAGH